MKAPQIRMTSQFAKIGMQQTLSKLYIEQQHADLSIEQPKATITMETTPSQLTIDQMAAWEQMNLKSTRKTIEEFAHEGMRAVAEGMQRRAIQGDELMNIESDGNPIVSQGEENGHRKQKQLGITFIPEPFSVKIDYEPSELHIDVVIHKPIIEIQTNKPSIDFERGRIDVYLEQYEQLNIDVENLFTDQI